MDLVRSCYETDMNVGMGQSGPVRWFFCEPGAKVFPGLTRFGSLNWLPSPIADDGVGEVLGNTRTWRNGSYPNKPTGHAPDGPLEDFVTGNNPEHAYLDLGFNGIPVNCVGLPYSAFACSGSSGGSWTPSHSFAALSSSSVTFVGLDADAPAFSMSGTSSAAFVGLGSDTPAFSMPGTSAAAFVGTFSVNFVFSMPGTSSAAFDWGIWTPAAFTVPADSSVAFVGRGAEEAAFSLPSESSSAWVGLALARRAFTLPADSSSAWGGSWLVHTAFTMPGDSGLVVIPVHTVTADFAAIADSSAAWASPVTVTATFNAAGSSSTGFVGVLPVSGAFAAPGSSSASFVGTRVLTKATLVQSASGTGQFVADTSGIAFAGSTTPGNFLVLSVQSVGPTTFTAPSGWAQAYAFNWGWGYNIEVWYFANCGSISSVAMVPGSTNTPWAIELAEFSGIVTSSPFDNAGYQDRTSGLQPPESGTTGTTSQTYELAIVAFLFEDISNFEPFSNGFTLVERQLIGVSQQLNLLKGDVTTISAVFTAANQNASGNWGAVICTFKVG